MATAQELKFLLTAENKASATIQKTANDLENLTKTATRSGTAIVSSSTKSSAAMGDLGRKAGMAGIQIQQLVGQVTMGTNPMQALSMQAADLGFVLGAPLLGAVIGIGSALIGTLIPSLFGSSEAAKELGEDMLDLANKTGMLGEEQRKFLDRQAAEEIRKQQEAVSDARDDVLGYERAIRALNAAQQDQAQNLEDSTDYEAEIASMRDKLSDATANLEYQEALLAETRKGNNEEAIKFIEGLEKQVALFDANKSATLAYDMTLKNLSTTQTEYANSLIGSLEAMEAEKEAQKERDKMLNDSTIKRLLEDENNIRNSYQVQLQTLRQFNNDKLISDEQYAMAKARIDQRMTQDSINSLAMGFQALGQYNKKAFAIGKAAGVASAIINTYQGATKALATYPPPFSYAMAAGQIAMGMAQVAQIKSASFSGRAVGGSVTAGVPYMVGEQGQEMFIPSTNGQIVRNSQLDNAGANQVNVSFTINAVDTAGFDQLLNSRRGQIVGMINRAMNERGRVGVV
jgi:hypothetical protein